MADFLIRHKVASRLGYLWAMAMVTMVLNHYVGEPLGSASAADGVILTAVVGLPAAAIAFLEWARDGGR